MSAFYQNRTEPFKSYQVTNYEFTPHLHNQLEIVYALSGSCDIQVDDIKYPFHTNDFAIIFPYQLHSFSHAKDCILLVQTFEPHYASEYIPFLSTHIPEVPVLSNIKDDFAYAVKKAHEYYIRGDNPLIIRSYVSVFMSFLFSSIQLVPAKVSAQQNIVHNLLIYIDKHYTEPLTLDILAKQLHVTRYYISRIFTQKLNTTFPIYLNRLRIEYAQTLLHHSSFSIGEVAYECGFESERTFYRAFQNQIHMTPLQFKKNLIINNKVN